MKKAIKAAVVDVDVSDCRVCHKYKDYESCDVKCPEMVIMSKSTYKNLTAIARSAKDIADGKAYLGKLLKALERWER